MKFTIFETNLDGIEKYSRKETIEESSAQRAAARYQEEFRIAAQASHLMVISEAGSKQLVDLRDRKLTAPPEVATSDHPGATLASGLRPEHGILAGAVAGFVGALFGGSKYNVYGPVAALIPVIAGIMAKYATPTDPFAGHGFIVAICVAAGVLMMPTGAPHGMHRPA